jgi:hypothetical protein
MATQYCCNEVIAPDLAVLAAGDCKRDAFAFCERGAKRDESGVVLGPHDYGLICVCVVERDGYSTYRTCNHQQ